MYSASRGKNDLVTFIQIIIEVLGYYIEYQHSAHVEIISQVLRYVDSRAIGAERAVLPLCVKAHFCDLRSPLRSRSATSRSALRSARFSTSAHRSAPLT